MARPRKSSDLKVFEGDRSRRAAQLALKPKGAPFCAVEVEPPIWLTGDVAREEWQRVATELQKAGRLADSDQALLGAYCESFALFRRALVQLAGVGGVDQVSGPVVVGARGGIMVNPWELVADRAYRRMARIADAFGFTPSARERLAPAPAAKDPKREKFFGK
jgi:P27 family predicted phage terminase small subunit